jgi:hypothetical protein
MSLTARLMDKRNIRLIANSAQKKEKNLKGVEKVAAKYENGAYTNGIQDL